MDAQYWSRADTGSCLALSANAEKSSAESTLSAPDAACSESPSRALAVSVTEEPPNCARHSSNMVAVRPAWRTLLSVDVLVLVSRRYTVPPSSRRRAPLVSTQIPAKAPAAGSSVLRVRRGKTTRRDRSRYHASGIGRHSATTGTICCKMPYTTCSLKLVSASAPSVSWDSGIKLPKIP